MLFVLHLSWDSHAKRYRKCVNCYISLWLYGCGTNCSSLALNASIYSYFANLYSVEPLRLKAVIAIVGLLTLMAFGTLGTFAQQSSGISQEISDVDGQPVLIKHLPDYNNVQASAVFGTDKPNLEKAIGEKPVIMPLEFPPGTEFVTAVYPQGRLLIIEYTNPQSSVEADSRVQQYLGAHPESGIVYRRIGNYNTFVFDASDADAAGALLDQIKYQKLVQWLGDDPYLLKRLERYMVTTSRDVMLSTVFVIVGFLVVSLLAGIAAGLIFFRVRDQKRANRVAFSDAGGLTRLNIDGLSE